MFSSDSRSSHRAPMGSSEEGPRWRWSAAPPSGRPSRPRASGSKVFSADESSRGYRSSLAKCTRMVPPDGAAERHELVLALGGRRLAAQRVCVAGREAEHRSSPKAMEDVDFERVIRDFGSAARLARASRARVWSSVRSGSLAIRRCCSRPRRPHDELWRGVLVLAAADGRRIRTAAAYLSVHLRSRRLATASLFCHAHSYTPQG